MANGHRILQQEDIVLNVSEARASLRELVDKVIHEKAHITLNRHGQPAAVLVPVEDAELLEILEDKVDLAEVRKVLKNPKPVSWDKAKRKLGL